MELTFEQFANAIEAKIAEMEAMPVPPVANIATLETLLEGLPDAE